MRESKRATRRQFIGRAALAGAAGLAAPAFLRAEEVGTGGKPGANGKIHLGSIGAGSMGQANLEACAGHADVAVTAACDVWKDRLDAVLAKHRETAKGHRDYRELLARKDVDAVVIATPPHWHALQAIDACEAGKDVYVQKPMTLYPDESIAFRNAAKATGRVTQVGTQIHAGENYRRVVEWVRSGRLGKVSVVRTFMVMNQGPGGIGCDPDAAPPPGLDWDLWVGPARLRPFNPLIVKDAYYHCSFMDYSGGWTPGMAPHVLDLPYWALGLGAPELTSCPGGRAVIRDAGDVPDTQEAVWRHGDVTVTWSMSLVNSYGFDFQGAGGIGRRLGVYFHGVDGTLYADYGTYKVVPEGDRLKDLAPPERTIPPSPGHEREWLDCVVRRKEPSASVAYSRRICFIYSSIECPLLQRRARVSSYVRALGRSRLIGVGALPSPERGGPRAASPCRRQPQDAFFPFTLTASSSPGTLG
ncbi:MAG: Gfo/Idh/MocA family oxidoreductase [Planctomycetes bacterium]|nr:Gfo/Idh/MocA family oxidoreductase [Planctomycetota bacterium]